MTYRLYYYHILRSMHTKVHRKCVFYEGHIQSHIVTYSHIQNHIVIYSIIQNHIVTYRLYYYHILKICIPCTKGACERVIYSHIQSYIVSYRIIQSHIVHIVTYRIIQSHIVSYRLYYYHILKMYSMHLWCMRKGHIQSHIVSMHLRMHAKHACISHIKMIGPFMSHS